jgi:hypothetical protein
VGIGVHKQMIMNMYVLWVVKACILVAGTNVSEQTFTLRENVSPQNGDSTFPRKVCTYPPNYAGLRRQKTAVLMLNATLSTTWQEI